ncbi:MAG: DNA gyrase subunit A, partial [Kangiellaceae bacterium]
YSRPRANGIIAVNLNEGDELIGVDLTDGSCEIMLFSNAGKVVRFSEEQVRPMGRTATGVRGIRIADTERVVSLIIPNADGDILTATENGYGKCTSVSEYPAKSRATKGVVSIKVSERNGQVIGAVQVSQTDEMMLISDRGTLVRTRVSEVSRVGRNTQGVTLIRTVEGEHVVGLQRIDEIIEDESILIETDEDGNVIETASVQASSEPDVNDSSDANDDLGDDEGKADD